MSFIKLLMALLTAPNKRGAKDAAGDSPVSTRLYDQSSRESAQAAERRINHLEQEDLAEWKGRRAQANGFFRAGVRAEVSLLTEQAANQSEQHIEAFAREQEGLHNDFAQAKDQRHEEYAQEQDQLHHDANQDRHTTEERQAKHVDQQQEQPLSDSQAADGDGAKAATAVDPAADFKTWLQKDPAPAPAFYDSSRASPVGPGLDVGR